MENKIITVDAAMIKDGAVINKIVVDPISVVAFEKVLIEQGQCDRLIIVDERVQIGDTFDADTGIFYRDDVRVYPAKTDGERIAELETQIEDTQAALIELAAIIGGDTDDQDISDLDTQRENDD